MWSVTLSGGFMNRPSGLRPTTTGKKACLATLAIALSFNISGTFTNGAQAASIADSARSSALAIDEFDVRISNIEKRLTEAYSAGRLSQTQYEKVRNDIRVFTEQAAVFKASDGSLSLWESLRLNFDFDHIVKDMEASLGDRQTGFVDVGGRWNEIQKRLADAFSLGRLTRQEFDDMSYQLECIKKSVDDAKSQSGTGQLSITDNIRFILALDSLSKKLTKTVHDRQTSLIAVDARQAELDKKIRDGAASGKLTTDEEKALRLEFDAIAQKEAQLRSLDRPYTAEEQLSLALDLERLNGKIDSQIYDSDTTVVTGPNVEERAKQLDAAIAQALNDGLLALSEAQVYNSELSDILLKSQQFTAGGLDLLKTQNLLVDIERLKGKVDRATYNKSSIWPGVEGTINDIDKRLSEAHSANRLEESAYSGIKGELNRLVALKADYRASQGLSTIEAITLVANLEQLAGRFSRSVEDRQIAFIPDVDKRKQEVSRRIAQGVVSGQLTAEESNALLVELERVSARQAAFKVDGALDEREKLTLALDLERLATKVEREIRDNPYVVKPMTERRQVIERALSTGSLNGTLSNQEVQALNTELSRILAYENASMTTDGLDASEAVQISKDLEKLAKDVEAATKNADVALPDIGKRQAELYQRITEGVMQGRLSAKDADNLKHDFYRVMDDEAKYRSSGGLSFGEQAALALELEKLANNIESSMREANSSMPDVDSRQAEFDKKLASSVASGQLTLTQAQTFTRELDRIARDEINYRFSGAGLSYAEALALVTELEKLNGHLDTQLAGRITQWATLDAHLQDSARQVGEALLGQKLSVTQATQFKRELDRIAQAKQAFTASGGGLTLAETESLVRDLDRFSVDFQARLGKGQNIAWTDIENRQARVEARLLQGRLPKETVKKARRDLQSLSNTKALYRALGRNYSYKEITTMAQTLDRLDRLVGIKNQ
jgi:hypothetical protein